MGHGCIIDSTVILLLCAQLTEITAKKNSTDHRNQTKCEDIVEMKQNTTFYGSRLKEFTKGTFTPAQCKQRCLETITCIHARHRGTQCLWTDIITTLVSHPGTTEITSYTVRFRCPRYFKCNDRMCRNGATCARLVAGQDVGIKCICAIVSSGWFCEQLTCYDQLCQNGGTCLKTRWGVKCTCTPYATGVRCESSTNRLAIIIGSTFASIAAVACIIIAIIVLRMKGVSSCTEP